MVNPRQIDVIHDVFAPKQAKFDYALEVMDAIKRAREMGTGVISLKGKMIDRPVVVRAARVLNTARAHAVVDVVINEEDIYGADSLGREIPTPSPARNWFPMPIRGPCSRTPSGQRGRSGVLRTTAASSSAGCVRRSSLRALPAV